MSESVPDLEDLLARTRKLESESRGLRIVCTLLLIIGGIALYQNFQARYEVLNRHGDVEVKGNEMETRAVIHAADFSSGLTFYDLLNQDRAMFGTSQYGSGLTLRDKHSNQRIILKVNDSGTEMLMADAKQVIRAALRVNEEGASFLLFDEEGNITFDSSRDAPPSGHSRGTESDASMSREQGAEAAGEAAHEE